MKTSSQSPLRYLLLVLIRLQSLKTSEQGFIVFFVASIIVLLSLIWVAYGLLSRIDSSSTAASVRSNSGFYAAEYGLNLRAKEIRETFEGYNRPSGSPPANAQACLQNNPGFKGSGDFICKQIDFQDPLYPRDSSAKNPVYTFVQDKTGGTPSLSVIPQGEPFAGLTAQAYKYDVISVAYDLQNQPTANLKITFRNLLIPLFQFAVFSENDADFSLPPNMTLNGPVHSNKSLYLNANASSTLAINGQVTVVDTLYRGLKYQNSGCSGTVTINSSTNSSIIPTALGCGSGSSRQGYATQASVSAWNNQIQVPINPLQVPPPDALDPTPGNLYWDRADLRIVLRVQNDAASVSGVSPIGIEVRNPDNSNNAALTNNLQACTPAIANVQSAANTATGTTITLSGPAAALSSYRTQNLPLLVGTSFDSLVATGPDTTGPGSVPDQLIDDGTTIDLRKRQLNPATLTGSVKKAILWSSDTFFNYREKADASGNYTLSGPNAGRYIRMLNVDMQGLIDCANSQNLMAGKALDDTTDGGLVWFFTVEGPNARNNVTASPSQPANNYGIRLYNGSSLSSTNGGPALKGLTVVSDEAVYIQGNYNSVNKIPAAILSDTMNVLSNRWNLDDFNAGRFDMTGVPDNPQTAANVSGATVLRQNQCVASQVSIGCNSGTPLRGASATTINAAFLSGLDIPGGANGTTTQDNGQTSSGVHNYPRFHENWFAIPLTYRGSLVALNVPRRVNSPFCGSVTTNPSCNIYWPPDRNWDFDTDFNDAAKLPPLTPRAVYLKQDAFTRNFSISAINSDSIAELFSPTRWLGFSLGLASP